MNFMSTWSALRIPAALANFSAASLSSRRPERPALLLARLVGLAGTPREQAVPLHLLDEAVEVLQVLRIAVLHQLVLHRRTDVTVDRHHDVAIVRDAPSAALLCAMQTPFLGHPTCGWHSVPPVGEGIMGVAL